MIPKDWECVKIKDVATISMCKRIFANQTSTIGDVPFYKIGTFGKEADAYISSKLYVEYRNKYSFPQKGDILISAAGTLGRTVVYDGEKAYFQDSNIVWLDINKTRLCNEYLNQYYKVIKWASSEGSTIARLYNGIIYATYISLPPLPEQQRIAEALSDVDGMISSLEKLVAKYKSIKTACLQQMFPQNGETVPRMRLPGFTGAWKQRKLGDIGKARSGVGFPDAEQGGVTGIPFFKVSDMNLGGNENEMTVANNYVTAEQIAVHRWSPITELPAIFFAKVGAAVMLNRKRLCRFPFLLDNNTMAYSLSPTKWDADFAKALFGTVDLTSLVQVGALPSYNARDVESMGIYLPSLLEQEQIGAFFKQLDHLITLHQRKLDKAKKIKQGMMQQLLTGKIRLNN